jgi:hypothetical protein
MRGTPASEASSCHTEKSKSDRLIERRLAGCRVCDDEKSPACAVGLLSSRQLCRSAPRGSNYFRVETTSSTSVPDCRITSTLLPASLCDQPRGNIRKANSTGLVALNRPCEIARKATRSSHEGDGYSGGICGTETTHFSRSVRDSIDRRHSKRTSRHSRRPPTGRYC